MDVNRELDRSDRENRLVGRLAAAYTLLELAPYTRPLDFAPGDMAAFVVKQAKKDGRLGKVEDCLGLSGYPGK